MVTDLKVGVPVSAFLCETCAADSAERTPSSDVDYAMTVIDVADEVNDQILHIDVDVKSLELRKVQQGRYEAYATVEVHCPKCPTAHEFSRRMHAPLVLLERVRECEQCHGPLSLDDEMLRFDDGENGIARI